MFLLQSLNSHKPNLSSPGQGFLSTKYIINCDIRDQIISDHSFSRQLVPNYHFYFTFGKDVLDLPK